MEGWWLLSADKHADNQLSSFFGGRGEQRMQSGTGEAGRQAGGAVLSW